MSPLDILSGLGYALDTPGALFRGALGNIADAVTGEDKVGWRASGRDLLERVGALGVNTEGLDPGDVAGFLAEMVLDPLNLVSAGAMAKLGSGLSKAAVKAGPRWRHAVDPVDGWKYMKETLGNPEAYASYIPPGSKRIGEGMEAYAVKTPSGRILRLAEDQGGSYAIEPRIAAAPLLQPSHSVMIPDKSLAYPPGIVENVPEVVPLDKLVERSIENRSRAFMSGKMPEIRARNIQARADAREGVDEWVAQMHGNFGGGAPGNMTAMSPWQPRVKPPIPESLLDDPLFVQSSTAGDIIREDANGQALSILQGLKNRAERAGFQWGDYGSSNAGILGREPVILDPGFITNTAGLPRVPAPMHQEIGNVAGYLADALGYTNMVRNQWEGLPWRSPTVRNALLAGLVPGTSAATVNAITKQ